ncbi:ATP-binding protein [Novosphingobium sp. RD2P27]|uniref:histidine kinase n=1 Tax=Novosphingobium kalidii TaxID=3230299 RepID=A0ABV2CY84_9SPHN
MADRTPDRLNTITGRFALVVVAIIVAVIVALQVSGARIGLFLALSLLPAVIACAVMRAHARDKTALKKSEHRVNLLLKEVEAHHQTERELKKAKEVAEAANLAKSRYLVSVSHEIRSPLNSIYGYSQLLERGLHVSPSDAAKVIRRSSEHLTNLVEGLLDISQVESGVLRISMDTVRLPALLDQIANMFRPQADAKGIAFHFERPEHLPDFVRTDQKRLRQILINLLSNAIKFTPRGSVTLRVQYRSQLAIMDVIDTGIGISQDDIQQIFEPFERGGNPDAHRQKGVGLGLSITHALVRILGGDLAVQSEPGKGSQFTVKLMLGQVATAQPDPSPAESLTGYEGKRRKVLVVDDDPAQTAVIRSLLEPLGFVVFDAPNGMRGFEIAVQERPDLVLLDISMPGQNGWDVCAQIRAELGPECRIVMVSANAHEFQQGRDGRAHHDLFLKKPVELDAILDAVSDLLSLQWVGAASEGGAHLSTVEDLPPLPSAAAEIRAEIERAAIIGHVRGVESAIRELEARFPEAAPHAARLHGQLDRFDLKMLLKTVRAFR